MLTVPPVMTVRTPSGSSVCRAGGKQASYRPQVVTLLEISNQRLSVVHVSHHSLCKMDVRPKKN
jgi:hypothetical protein